MKPGAILLSGKNITENQILTETYLVTFEIILLLIIKSMKILKQKFRVI